jgi:hypothetical protein
MTEIVALQLFLTDVLSPVACGERMSAEQYQLEGKLRPDADVA